MTIFDKVSSKWKDEKKKKFLQRVSGSPCQNEGFVNTSGELLKNRN